MLFGMMAVISLTFSYSPSTPLETDLVQLNCELSYPPDYQYVPNSIAESIQQLNNPLPAPFAILKQTEKPPESKQNQVVQHFTYTLQPQLTGNFPLLLNAQLQRSDSQIQRVFAIPQNIQIYANNSIAKLDVPPLYDPEKPLDVFPEHSQRKQSRIAIFRFPWLEGILSLLACLVAGWIHRKRQEEDRKLIVTDVITRFRILRAIRAAYQSGSPTLAQISEIEDMIKRYLHIPEALTPEEAEVYAEKYHAPIAKPLAEFLNLTSEAKFSQGKGTTTNLQNALEMAIQMSIRL